jgi:hypothetical protein
MEKISQLVTRVALTIFFGGLFVDYVLYSVAYQNPATHFRVLAVGRVVAIPTRYSADKFCLTQSEFFPHLCIYALCAACVIAVVAAAFIEQLSKSRHR